MSKVHGFVIRCMYSFNSVALPMITSHPTNLNVNAGTDVSFSVTATGGVLVYQWMKDGVNIFNTPFKYTGTNSSSLIVLSVNDPDDEGIYSVTVNNTHGTVPSNESTLSIGKYIISSSAYFYFK